MGKQGRGEAGSGERALHSSPPKEIFLKKKGNLAIKDKIRGFKKVLAVRLVWAVEKVE